VYVLPKMVEIDTAELSFVEKLARVPEAPVPVLEYSWKVTAAVFGVLLLHCSHPALLIRAPKAVFWKQTLAYWLHGRPRYTVPAPAVELETVDLLMT